jgi:hypothetical protein
MTDEQMKKLREPFSPKQISQRPKPTSAQNTCPPNEKINCTLCGGWHHSKVQHLSYVGHGAVTHRLLEVDALWNWEPLAVDDNGLPRFDETGGLWIRLTICGHTRLGYGNAVFNKFAETGSREKEVIGDCLKKGTLITTKRGDIKIEDVKIGDFVPTRKGWKKVTDHWLSHKFAPVKKVILSNGMEIIGTPHHKIPTNKCEKRIDALRNGDIMYSFNKENSKCHLSEKALPAKMLNLMGVYIGENPITSHCIEKDTLWQQQSQGTIFIGIFTNFIMEKYQKTFISITKTITSTITTLQILLRSIRLNTQKYTLIPRRELFVSATNVEINTQPYWKGQGGVVQHVKKGEEEKRVLPTLNLNNQLKLKNLHAMSAVEALHQQNLGLNFVEVSVEEVVDAGIEEVWNLSVEDVHEYVANGILVNNCIRNAAMRFGVALDLWSKADLESTDDNEPATKPTTPAPSVDYFALIEDSKTLSDLAAVWKQIPSPMKPTYMKVKDAQKKAITDAINAEDVPNFPSQTEKTA